MRIFITGGSGFIGSHLCDLLISEGHEFLCLDNLITGTTDNITHLAFRSQFSFCKDDVTNDIFIDGKVIAVLPFASPASSVDYLNHPIQPLKVGSLGTHKALGLAQEKKARFLLATTSEVYGDPLVYPQSEDYWGKVNPFAPRAVYDEANRFAEDLTMAYHRYYGVDTRTARIFNTYGPRMCPNDRRVVPNFILQALGEENLTVYGDGSQTRSFCDVDDLVEGIMKLLFPQETDPVNLGNPDEFSIADFAKMI